jgi:hypothetical protein
MATISLIGLSPNNSTAATTGTASGATNIISTAGVPLEEIMLVAYTTTATTNVTVKGGDYPPALSAGQGDLVVACPVGTTYIGPLSSARFMQDDGTLNVNVATAANVALAAVRVPRTA